jgi:hypothetical protein
LSHSLLDLPAFFDPIDRIEGVIFTFRNADWCKARKRGAFWVLVEFVRCVLSLNTVTHEFKMGATSGAKMEAMLKRHGVKIGDRGLAPGKRLYFITKSRQARWADYLMRRYGMDNTSQVDPRNEEWATRARETRGKEPPVRKLPRQRKKGWGR